MKIVDIEIDSKMLINFNYKDKPYSLIVQIIAKSNQCIIIPAILENNEAVDPGKFAELSLVYAVRDGVYQFKAVKLESANYQGMRVYHVSSDEDMNRMNRRNAYRVFIGELVKISVTTEKGKKKTLEGILKNVSITGMGILLKNEIEVGSIISILYNFEGIYFHLQGEVVRKEKISRYRAFSYGCVFKDPNYSINRVVLMKQIRAKNENASKEQEK